MHYDDYDMSMNIRGPREVLRCDYRPVAPYFFTFHKSLNSAKRRAYTMRTYKKYGTLAPG